MLTKKAVPQFPSLQLYTSQCTVLTVLPGQLQIAMHVRNAHLVVLQTVMFQCHTTSLHVSARCAHMVLIPLLGAPPWGCRGDGLHSLTHRAVVKHYTLCYTGGCCAGQAAHTSVHAAALD